MHTLFLVYFVNLNIFRAYLGPSSEGTTVCIQQLVFIILFRWLSVVLVGLELQYQSNQDNRQSSKRIISTNCIHVHRLYLLMMGLDTPEICRGWRNILRISCASSWLFFTRNKRDIGSVYSFVWGTVPKFAWRCEVNHENSWCSLFTGRDLNLGSPECEAGIIYSGLRFSFSKEVVETG